MNRDPYRFDILAGIAVLAVVSAIWGAVIANAQEKPKETPAASVASVDVQPIAADAQKLLQALAARAGGLEDAKAVLQKELDAVTAAWTRTIAKVQAEAPAGYELGPNLTYVKKTK